MYLKLMVLNTRSEFYDCYEKFRGFEIEYSCKQVYSKEFNILFEKRIRQGSKSRADYLHFRWVDFITGYHKRAQKFSYSVYGIIAFLKGGLGGDFFNPQPFS